MHKYSIGPEMTKGELLAGLIWLPFYVVALSAILRWGAALLGFSLSALQLNILCDAVHAVVCLVLFHRFLLAGLRAIRFWELVQAVILGYAMYRFGNWLLTLAISCFGLDSITYNDEAMLALAAQAPQAMRFCAVILAPLVEEVLVRGLLFGCMHRKSRIGAYAVSAVVFCMLHVWQHIPQHGLQALWPDAVLYLPASIALGWCYEKAGTVWAPIALHILCNAVTLGMIAL